MEKDTTSLLFNFLVLCSWWDLSSLTRDGTRALGSESAESQPLDCQGIPTASLLSIPATNAQPKCSHLTQHTSPYWGTAYKITGLHYSKERPRKYSILKETEDRGQWWFTVLDWILYWEKIKNTGKGLMGTIREIGMWSLD